jgi:hypothetical protein
MTELDLDPDFIELTVYEQLEKVVVSASNPFPRDYINTDDGQKISGVTPKDAIAIRSAVLRVEKPADRLEVLKNIQQSQGFKEILQYVRSQ